MAEILTNNAMFSSFMIVLIVFALGDIVGKLTKGKLSGMMVVMLLFLAGFLTKLFPADIIDQGGLTALSKLAIAMVLFNMGTTLNVKQLVEEWKTVLMAALCMLASCIVMLLVTPIIGFDTVLVGMPVINGAAMATSLMASAAAEKGLATAAALCAVIYSVQKFVGAPIASAMGIRYGKKLLKAYRENPAQFKKQETGNGASAKASFADKHKEWYSANVMMAIVAAGSWIAHILGDLLERFIGDAAQDRGGFRGGVHAVFGDAEEVAGAEFVDIFMGFGIHEQRNREAFFLGEFCGFQAGSVVAAQLDGAGAQRCRTVVIFNDHGADRFHAAFVIRTDRHDHDEQFVIGGGSHTDLGTYADIERADVERTAGSVGRNVFNIVQHNTADQIFEEINGESRAENAFGGHIQAAGVFIRAEYADLAVFAAERLQAFECGLSVMQTGGGDGHGDIGIRQQFAFAPCTVPVGCPDMGFHRHVAESQTAPVDVGSDLAQFFLGSHFNTFSVSFCSASGRLNPVFLFLFLKSTCFSVNCQLIFSKKSVIL